MALMRSLGSFGGRRGALWLVSLLLLVPSGVFALQTTSVQGIVYRANGTIAQGTILVSWPAFTAADGSTIAAGSTTTTIAPDGSVSLALAPNGGANPAGTYYTVVYHLNDGTVEKEYWVVPQAPTATISEMRARVVPAAVAQQTVSQQYVDASISALSGNYLQLKGGTMSGSLNLAGDPAGPMQAATKEYVDAHAGGGAQLPASQNVIAGKGDGTGLAMPEEGITVSGSNAVHAWHEDYKGGIYDARNPRYAGGIYGATPWLALQAVSNQMACDVAMGNVTSASITLPPGTFQADELAMAPGSHWSGAKTGAFGGTKLLSKYNGRWLAHMYSSMSVTCSDGKTYTAGGTGGVIEHMGAQGCATGGCVNFPGDTNVYQFGGPGNVGFQMGSPTGLIQYVNTDAFGGYGIRVDGCCTVRGEHLRSGSSSGDNAFYYYGTYKGVTEGAASAEFTGTVASGTTGSIALTWAAVTSPSAATGYVVYRGSKTGGENTWYKTNTNSFTDTCAAGGSGTVAGGSQGPLANTEVAATTPTATGSTTGGSCAAGTYYYIVTPTLADGWHGTMELVGTDGMYDWIEPYGFMDPPNKYNYHHLTDIELAGGTVTLAHAFPQWGQVGINIGPSGGGQETLIAPRVDFSNLEGIYVEDGNVNIIGGDVGSSCKASNIASVSPTGAATCYQLYQSPGVSNLYADGLKFLNYAGFGPNYATSDYAVFSGRVIHGADGVAETTGSESGPNGYLYSGSVFEPTSSYQFVTTGSVPNVAGKYLILPSDTTPTNITGFAGLMPGQWLAIIGGDANDTLVNSASLRTCNAQNINLGSLNTNGNRQMLLFYATGWQGSGNTPGEIWQICDTPTTVASTETVSFSATPTFSTLTRASNITLTGNITSFILAAGFDGQEKTLVFCQNATGGSSVAAPTNVRGFMTVGTTANMCSSQHFTYSAAKSAWLADSPGVTNE